MLVTMTKMVLENTKMSETKLRARTAFKPINSTVGGENDWLASKEYQVVFLKVLTCANMHHNKKYMDVMLVVREAGSEI